LRKTKFKKDKKKKKPRQRVLFSKRLKNTIQSELKKYKKVGGWKKKVKEKLKKPTSTL